MEIGEKLKAIRKHKELSVYKLSQITDISENFIHDIEKCTKQPSVYTIERLLGAMGVTISEFFNENDNVIYPSDFELKLIHTVRTLTEEKANAVLNLAELLSK